jgi:hypothetical protein
VITAQVNEAMCLDVVDGSTRAGARVQLFPCHGGANQRWTATAAGELRIYNNTMCLDAHSGAGRDGDKMIIWTCHGGRNQVWRYTAASELKGINDKCVDIDQGELRDGAITQVYTCHGGSNQRWNAPTLAGATPAPAPAPAPPLAPAPAPSPAPGGGSCGVVTDLGTRSTPSLAKPGYLASVVDPVFKTTITRITGDPGTPIQGVGGSWGTVATHEYSKDAAWSADQRLLVLKRVQGSPASHLFLDGTTYQPLFAKYSPGRETRWHPQIADVMVYLSDNGVAGHWNVRTGSTTPRFTASGYSAAQFGPYEGNLSRDGNRMAMVATRASDGRRVAFAADLSTGQKSPDIDLAANGISSVDWASISALGNYVVIFATIDGVEGRTKVFTRDGSLVGSWTSPYLPGHFDLTTDASGNEVAVGAGGSNPFAKKIIMRRLDSGVSTLLAQTSFNQHTSTRNTQRPGWAYHSIHNTESPFDREIYAVKLDGSGAVERFAHHRSNVTEYNAEPHAVPSPDGRRVLFASNWGGSRPIQTYVVDVRPLCQ